MTIRSVLLVAASFVVLAPSAQAKVGGPERDWVAMVVSKISEKASKGEARASVPVARRATVSIRVRVASDGAVDDVTVEESSGSSALDARAVEAAKSAGPFRPPPARLLSLEGTTELSFPLDLGKRATD